MNKDKKIERLEQKLAKAHEEIKELKYQEKIPISSYAVATAEADAPSGTGD